MNVENEEVEHRLGAPDEFAPCSNFHGSKANHTDAPRIGFASFYPCPSEWGANSCSIGEGKDEYNHFGSVAKTGKGGGMPRIERINEVVQGRRASKVGADNAKKQELTN